MTAHLIPMTPVLNGLIWFTIIGVMAMHWLNCLGVFTAIHGFATRLR